jgi:hypothetical protein
MLNQMPQLLYNPTEKKGKRFVNSSMFEPLTNGSSFKKRDIMQVNVQIKKNRM